MSLKGLQKGLVRAKHRGRALAKQTQDEVDAEYDDAELRFAALERETKKLKEESAKYFQAINGMLDHQIDFSKACAEIYKPISGRASDPSSFVIDSSPEGIRAAEEYIAVVNDLKTSLTPELALIKSRVVDPAQELMEIVQAVRKRCAKRNRKKTYYEEARIKLKNLQAKPDKSAKDEKALYDAENAMEEMTVEYNEINEELKEQLIDLLSYEKEFILPLFQSFYYMQLNVFYTLHEAMQSMDIGYFNLTRDIEEAFQEKRGDIQEQAEALTIVKFKTTGRPRPPRPSRLAAIENGRPGSGTRRLALENGKTTSPSDSHDTPPPYESGGLGRSSSIAKNKAAPPPPKPKPGRLSGAPNTETATALYDYDAQVEGDLTLRAGETIEIITRTENENEWWTGKIGARQGQFPANYVQLNS